MVSDFLELLGIKIFLNKSYTHFYNIRKLKRGKDGPKYSNRTK